MTEFKRLRLAREHLVSDVRQIIHDSYELSKSQGKPISDGNFDGHFSAADFFNSVIIDPQIKIVITAAITIEGCKEYKSSVKSKTLKELSNSIESIPVDLSIGGLLKCVKNLRKAKWCILIAERYLKNIPVNEQSFSIDVKNAKIDYLIDLYHCFESILVLVRKSKACQRETDGYFLEYCALCWRLVNKYKFLNFADSDNYSVYYCLEHHPTFNKQKHERAKSALAAAMRQSDHEMKEIFIKPNKNNNSLKPLTLYRATATFAKKIVIATLETDTVVFSWRERVGFIVELAKRDYPYAAKLITTISINELSSWQEWFYAVINALDASKNDASSWNDSCVGWGKMSDDMASYSPEVGADVLLNILRRYESVCNINTMARPRGPQKGAVKKNENLIGEIECLAKIQLMKNGKINGAQITRDIIEGTGKNVSRQHIHKVIVKLKEEGRLCL